MEASPDRQPLFGKQEYQEGNFICEFQLAAIEN
jgi:hypothetical protein